MKIEDWKLLLSRKSRDNKQTGAYDTRFTRFDNGIKYDIFKAELCDKCGRSEYKEMTVIFKKPVYEITLFQTEILFAIYVLGKVPLDYASYHKCPAGRKFIANIDRLEK